MEIVDPFDELSDDERQTLEAAFEIRSGPDGQTEFVLKRGLSTRAVMRAHDVIVKHPRLIGSWATQPEPPQWNAWCVWHLKQADPTWTYDALAADDSPVRNHLHGSTSESRKQLAMRAVEAVEQFRSEAPAWWFEMWMIITVNSDAVTD